MARDLNGAWLAIGVAGAVAAAGVAMGGKGSKNGRPTYYRLIQSGSKWSIYASPSNVIVATGSKTKMMKQLEELEQLQRKGAGSAARAAPSLDAEDMKEMVDDYLMCALWSSNDESTPAGGEPFDANFSVSDFTKEARARATKECKAFVKKAEEAGVEWEQDPGQIGHDFWLTRNHHGAGFWDRGIKHGDTLTEIAQAFGEQRPWANRGRVHLE